jgi:hypothetical protein
MALDVTKMSVVATGGGQKLWLYNTTDASATVLAANYFTTTDLPNMSAFDFIIAVCTYGVAAPTSSGTLKMAVTNINTTRSSVVYLP